MALKQTNNGIGEVFLQNENLQTEKYIGACNSNVKTHKNNSSGIKYGLSELSNDKTYLETEFPARKRFRPETELFNTMKHLNKMCKVVGNDDELVNFVNEEKYSGEITNILSSEQRFENPQKTELLNGYINRQNDSSALKSDTCDKVFHNSILCNQFKSESNELTECNFEMKSDNHDFEPNSENDLHKHLDKEKISNQGENETEFDEEINKCYELLNLDVPTMAVVSTTANDNFGNKMIEKGQIHKCEIVKHLDTLYHQPNDEDINLRTISVGKKLKMQDKLVNNKEKCCTDNMDFKEEGNLVISTMAIPNFFSTTCGENCINMNDNIFHDEMYVSVEDNNSLESEFQYNDKKNQILKINNILNVNSTSSRESNVFIPDMIQNHDSKSNIEHLNLTTEDTLSSDTLKSQEINQEIISQDHLNDDKDEVLSTVYDPGDILILYDESDIDFDENKEICDTNASESAHVIFEGTSENNGTVFDASFSHYSGISRHPGNEIEKEDNFILSEKTDLCVVDESHPLDNKICKSPVLDGILNNDSIENKNNFDDKEQESFVSEYEISLLIDDTDSILSEESFDSEYEISLLEDDINEKENQIDVHETKSDSNIRSKYLPNDDEKDEKIIPIPQADFKASKTEYEKDQTTNNVNLCEKETEEVIFENKICSKSISEKNIACLNEIIQSNCYEHKKFADKTDLDVEILAQREEMQISSKIESSENANDKTEQHFTAVTDGTIILKLDQPITLRSEKENILDNILIKKELSENTKYSQFQLKLEIDNEPGTQNEVILNNNADSNSEENPVTTNEHHGDSSCTDNTIINKFVTAERDVFDAVEAKNIKDKVAFNSKMNETKISDEKVLNVNTNKEFIENNYTDKAIGGTTVKTELGVSTRNELKLDAENIIPDYYEEEKEDLINPGWNKIKELSTDEERYRQVRDCWESKNIPNPFKNLTHYSYRKRKINYGENNTRVTRQHKRHASSNLNDNNSKRSRTCTYMFDDRIKSIEKKKEMQAQNIQNKMYDEVSRLNEECLLEEMRLQKINGYNFYSSRQRFELNGLKRNFQQRISFVSAEYEQEAHNCYNQYTSEINSLKNNRNEVLQFYSFYKGLNANEYKDPTILTNAQIQELEEIENIYNQMDLHYR